MNIKQKEDTDTQNSKQAEDLNSASMSQESYRNNKHQLAAEHEVTPIIFEECYVKNDESHFVQQVKMSYEVSEMKITARNEMEGFN